MAERIDVAFVLVSDSTGGQVLLVRNRDTWSLPGGRREAGETLGQTAAREAKEEAGVDVVVGPILDISEQVGERAHEVFHVFRAELLSEEAPTPRPDDEDVSAAAWMPVETASALMPWYPAGVAVMLQAGGAAYRAVWA